MKNRLLYNPIRSFQDNPTKGLSGFSSSGFIIADFLFSFVLILGIGIFVFALTFSLASIEVAQYIVWSSARNYSVGNFNEESAKQNARKKFQNLSAKFPLLTGNGAAGTPWLELLDSNLIIGNLATLDTQFSSEINSDDVKNNFRQPWIGVSAKLKLNLFAGLQVPFLGKVASNESFFEFPIRAFILRHPSQNECQDFFYKNRYAEGIKKLENNTLAPKSASALPSNGILQNGSGEDNGC